MLTLFIEVVAWMALGLTVLFMASSALLLLIDIESASGSREPAGAGADLTQPTEPSVVHLDPAEDIDEKTPRSGHGIHPVAA